MSKTDRRGMHNSRKEMSRVSQRKMSKITIFLLSYKTQNSISIDINTNRHTKTHRIRNHSLWLCNQQYNHLGAYVTVEHTVFSSLRAISQKWEWINEKPQKSSWEYFLGVIIIGMSKHHQKEDFNKFPNKIRWTYEYFLPLLVTCVRPIH